MPSTPRQSFRLNELTWKQFQKKCAAKGYSASDVLRAFIIKVVQGQLSVTSVKPSKTSRGEMLVSEEAILDWLKQDSHSS